MQLPPPQPPPQPYFPNPAVVYNMGTHGLAVASALVGISTWFFCPVIGGLAAVIMGHVAMAELKNSPRAGRGWATVGLIAGYGQLAFFGLLLVVIIVAAFLGSLSSR